MASINLEERVPYTAEEVKKMFQNITSTQSVDEQAMSFLRAFVGTVKFEVILALAEEFKTFAIKMKGKHIQELDEFETHQ